MAIMMAQVRVVVVGAQVVVTAATLVGALLAAQAVRRDLPEQTEYTQQNPLAKLLSTARGAAVVVELCPVLAALEEQDRAALTHTVGAADPAEVVLEFLKVVIPVALAGVQVQRGKELAVLY